MANWLTCKLTGRHEFTVWCEGGSMFLRCSNCGRRSAGWQVADKPPAGRNELGRPPASRRTSQGISRLSIVRPD